MRSLSILGGIKVTRTGFRIIWWWGMINLVYTNAFLKREALPPTMYLSILSADMYRITEQTTARTNAPESTMPHIVREK
jgi:hypothetical protein